MARWTAVGAHLGSEIGLTLPEGALCQEIKSSTQHLRPCQSLLLFDLLQVHLLLWLAASHEDLRGIGNKKLMNGIIFRTAAIELECYIPVWHTV